MTVIQEMGQGDYRRHEHAAGQDTKMGAVVGFETASPPNRLPSLMVGPCNHLSGALSGFVSSCFNEHSLEESKVLCSLVSSCARASWTL